VQGRWTVAPRWHSELTLGPFYCRGRRRTGVYCGPEQREGRFVGRDVETSARIRHRLRPQELSSRCRIVLGRVSRILRLGFGRHHRCMIATI
jgi:hypothetical protein